MANIFIFDIYTMVAEPCISDPKKPLRTAYPDQDPIFLGFGDKEPFIPGTTFNGLTDLDAHHHTVHDPMTTAGTAILKIYPDTGLIHTDNPVNIRRRRGLRDQGFGRYNFAACDDRHDRGLLVSALPVARRRPARRRRPA